MTQRESKDKALLPKNPGPVFTTSIPQYRSGPTSSRKLEVRIEEDEKGELLLKFLSGGEPTGYSYYVSTLLGLDRIGGYSSRRIGSKTGLCLDGGSNELLSRQECQRLATFCDGVVAGAAVFRIVMPPWVKNHRLDEPT